MAPALRELLARRMPGPVADAAAITVAATAGTAPLMAAALRDGLARLAAREPARPRPRWRRSCGSGCCRGALAQVSPALAAPLNALDGPLLAYLTAVARTAARRPVRVGAGAARVRRPRSRSRSRCRSRSAAAVRAAERRLPPAGPRARRAGRRLRAGCRCAAALGCVAVGAVLGWRHAHPRLPRRPRGAGRVVPGRRPGRRDADPGRRRHERAVRRRAAGGGRPARAARRGRAAPGPRRGHAPVARPPGRPARRAGARSRRGCCSRTATARATRTSAACSRRPTRAGSAACRPAPARCWRSGGLVVRVLAPGAAAARRAAARGSRTRAASPRSSAPATSTSGCPPTPRAARSCRCRCARSRR